MKCNKYVPSASSEDAHETALFTSKTISSSGLSDQLQSPMLYDTTGNKLDL